MTEGILRDARRLKPFIDACASSDIHYGTTFCSCEDGRLVVGCSQVDAVIYARGDRKSVV